MKIAQLKTTIVFEKVWNEYLSKKHRLVILEGGTGSSKSISLAQLFALIILKEKDVQLTVARKTFPALRATMMKDFFNILKGMGVYQDAFHNKTEHTFRYPPTNSEIDFLSIDEPMRVRSRRRNYLLLNEANEFNRDDYMQLAMRTDKQIFMDYNPSHQYHWIYDEVQTRDDCITIASTYKDNPFLPPEIVKEIEGYKDKDQNYWRIYGLGLRGIAETLIYTHWQFCDEMPDVFEKKFFGLDFGFNNPTALVEVREKDRNYYWKEWLYDKYLTNQDLIGRLHKLVEDGMLKYTDEIYADSAEPARIEEIRREEFNIISCHKGEIKDGIDAIKSHGFFITKDSVDLLKEVKSYNWREKDNKQLDDPVKENDHLLDAGRYSIITDSKRVPVNFEWI